MLSTPAVDRWFATEVVEPGTTLYWESHVHPFIRSNIWHVQGTDRDLLVDTGLGVVSLRQALGRMLDKPMVVVATHTHFDHVGSMYEFEIRAVHRAEAPNLSHPNDSPTLLVSDIREEDRQVMAEAGYPFSGELLLTAYPYEGFLPHSFTTRPTAPTLVLEEGDTIDLGNRIFVVLHLPGHSPGSIGLWEEETRTLFSGDVVYDNQPLLDELPESTIDDYLTSMHRIRDLPVRVVHAGHEPSFGRAKLLEIVDSYLAKRKP